MLTSFERPWYAQKLLSWSRPLRNSARSGFMLQMMSTILPVTYPHWKAARRKMGSSVSCSIGVNLPHRARTRQSLVRVVHEALKRTGGVSIVRASREALAWTSCPGRLGRSRGRGGPSAARRRSPRSCPRPRRRIAGRASTCPRSRRRTEGSSPSCSSRRRAGRARGRRSRCARRWAGRSRAWPATRRGATPRRRSPPCPAGTRPMQHPRTVQSPERCSARTERAPGSERRAWLCARRSAT